MQNMNIIESAHFSAAIASAMTGLVESHADDDSTPRLGRLAHGPTDLE